MKFRVWFSHLGYPGDPFYREVADPYDARKILDAIAAYDIYLGDNRLMEDRANAGGLEVMDDYPGSDWEEWADADGNDIWEISI